MIPFQLGFRNLIGILVPGSVLSLVIFTCLDVLFPGIGQAVAKETGNSTGPPVVAFLLTAYILGNVIRLWSANAVDQLSASLVKFNYRFKGEQNQDAVERNLDRILQCTFQIDP